MKRRYSWSVGILVSVILLLVALRFSLPYLVRDYLNEKLADMGNYHGKIADVDLALWRGAYKINGLQIVKVDGKIPVPFVDAPVMDLAVSWHSLWHDHAVVARVEFFTPEINFVDGGANKQNSQTGEGTDWREQLDKLLPITLNEVQIHDGRISFRNFNSTPAVNMNASEVNASIYNLTNVADIEGRRNARFDGKALFLGHAPLETTATFDPLGDFENFEFRLRARGIELKRMNDFSSAYGKFDFNAGHGDIVIEAKAENAQVSGYIKPLLRDVDVFNWQQDAEDKNKSFFRSVWEALVGGTETVLKNQGKNQFATRVELSGNVHQQNISAFEAFLQILRNGFIQAFNAQYERPEPDEG